MEEHVRVDVDAARIACCPRRSLSVNEPPDEPRHDALYRLKSEQYPRSTIKRPSSVNLSSGGPLPNSLCTASNHPMTMLALAANVDAATSRCRLTRAHSSTSLAASVSVIVFFLIPSFLNASRSCLTSSQHQVEEDNIGKLSRTKVLSFFRWL